MSHTVSASSVARYFPSVPELVMTILRGEDTLKDVAPGGVTVGAPEQDKQQLGAVAVAPAGQSRNEKYLPLVRQLIGVRCIATSEVVAERMAGEVKRLLHEVRRRVIAQPSTDQQYLIHWITVTGGPSLVAGVTEDFKEVSLIIEVMVGTEPVG